jgi:hypothetical protein
METLRWKTRIALLWVIVAVSMSAHIDLVAVDPSAMKIAAEWAATAVPVAWVFMALFWLVPLWMAFATMTVKGSSNRRANFIVGIVFTILNIWHFFMCGVPIKGGLVEPTAHHILLVGSTVVATALIAWYAWKWPAAQDFNTGN